jgi:hypothetical protein
VSDFDQQIERELGRVLDPILFEPAPPWRPPARGIGFKLAGGAGTALAAKFATGVVIAAFAAGAAEATITHSLNPIDWGNSIKHQLQGGQAPSGQHHVATSPAAHASASAAAPRATPSGAALTPLPVKTPPLPSVTPVIPSVSPIALPTVSPPPLP